MSTREDRVVRKKVLVAQETFLQPGGAIRLGLTLIDELLRKGYDVSYALLYSEKILQPALSRDSGLFAFQRVLSNCDFPPTVSLGAYDEGDKETRSANCLC
jgi:hypothetical protein